MNHFEIQKMVRFVSTLDIGDNPEPAAIFDPLTQGFNLWAIPSDHPGGDWHLVVDRMDTGAWSKRCAYVGTAFYNWEHQAMKITTDAYLLRDALPHYRKKSIHNRADDVDWVKDKVIWVFAQIGLECPPIIVGDDD